MIYLDHAAATPVSKQALDAMLPFFTTEFFNPSAAYLPAKKVRDLYEDAKNDLAHTIGAKGVDLIITAGATEANNLAFKAIFSGSKASTNLGASPSSPSQTPRDLEPAQILYLETEHASVKNLAASLGGMPVKILPRNGRIDLDDLKSKIRDETKLISVSAVNNEIGVIQPLSEIAAIVGEERLKRLKTGNKTPLYFHSDASQALGLLNLNVARLGVDLLTLNSAKIYGPKGIGALYVAHGVRLKPLVVGGGQEQGLRSGTENVPGLIGFARAAMRAREHLSSNRKKYAEFKRLFLKTLGEFENKTGSVATAAVFDLVPAKNTLDNFVNLCYNGIDGERLIYLLEEREIYVATGAACAASKGEKSYVLKALGLSDSEINGSLRITFGETNTREQIIEAARILGEVVAKERERIAKNEA